MSAESKPRLAQGFRDGVIVRSSQNFLIVMGYKGLRAGSENERFFITPLSEAAEHMLIEAAGLHRINTETRPVKDISGDILERTCIRLDFSQENWDELVCQDILLKPDEKNQDTSPTLQRLNWHMRRKTNTYWFPAKT